MTDKKYSEDIVLICNPSAGGRWRQLAGIFDSAEAQHVRRVVTDSLDDIGPALSRLSKRVKLVCIYGGDGTIQKLLTEISRNLGENSNTSLALIGGGTMNVTARWCGWTQSPPNNFRKVVHYYLTDKLVTKEVPLLEIRQGDRLEYGFTFGMGPIIRLLNEYEQGRKGKIAALQLAVQAMMSIWGKSFAHLRPLQEPMTAEVLANGEQLPHHQFSALFCSITGRIEIGIHPFPHERQRETFYYLAYAAPIKEVSMLAPFLARGMLPFDPKSLIKPVSSWGHLGLAYFGHGSLPFDPRYINRTAQTFEIRTSEQFYTIDGDLFESNGEPISIRLGPTLRLALAKT